MGRRRLRHVPADDLIHCGAQEETERDVGEAAVCLYSLPGVELAFSAALLHQLSVETKRKVQEQRITRYVNRHETTNGPVGLNEVLGILFWKCVIFMLFMYLGGRNCCGSDCIVEGKKVFWLVLLVRYVSG